MAKASKKTQSKRRPPSKAKLKKKTAPLLASTANIRKAKPEQKVSRTIPVADLPNPAFAVMNSMARVTATYAELPYRLAQCRSPMDLWREQARFAQLMFNGFMMTAPSQDSPKGPKATNEHESKPGGR
jgi:hypothetical protein